MAGVKHKEDFEEQLLSLAKHSVKIRHPKEIQALVAYIRQHKVASIRDLIDRKQKLQAEDGDRIAGFSSNSLRLLVQQAIIFDALQQRSVSNDLLEFVMKGYAQLCRNQSELLTADPLTKIDLLVNEARQKNIDIGNYEWVALRPAKNSGRAVTDSGLESMHRCSELSITEATRPGSLGIGQVSASFLGGETPNSRENTGIQQPPQPPQLPPFSSDDQDRPDGSGDGEGGGGGGDGGGGGGDGAASPESARGDRRISFDLNFRLRVMINTATPGDDESTA